MASRTALFPPSPYGLGCLRTLGGVFVPLAVCGGQSRARHGRLVVKCHVSRAREGHKVLGGVVRRVAVNVVDVLIGAQSAAVRLFAHKAVLRDVAVRVGKVVAGHPDVPVAVRLLSTAAPSRTVLARFAALVVPAQESDGVALVLAELRARLLGDRSLAAAPTLALAAWNRALRRLQRELFAALSEFRRSLVVTREKSRRAPIAVMRSRNDSPAASALAVLHANNLVGSFSTVNTKEGIT